MRPSVVTAALVALAAAELAAAPARDAARYVEAVEEINAEHADDPGEAAEDGLAGKIPRSAASALERVLEADADERGLPAALLECGRAALDLAAMDDFGRVRARLLEVDPKAAAELGDAVARGRFVVRGTGGLGPGYLGHFADVTDAVLDAYGEVFGFAEWSKVPGKKIRIRLRLVDRITRPPHFAPQFPYHSEIDMPVSDAAGFRSPTPQGQMMFYGLCHELGHLVAMWGDREHMEDHHAWAHYTGVTVVEHMSESPRYRDILTDLHDVRWRSLALERAKPENRVAPSSADKDGVMALLIRLHDTAGPEAIGAALNLLDETGAGHRINRVRYYRFSDLRDALAQVIDDAETAEAARTAFRGVTGP